MPAEEAYAGGTVGGIVKLSWANIIYKVDETPFFRTRSKNILGGL
jgi:hypothetical protein